MAPRNHRRPEQRAVVAEVLALLRHELRNKLATVRNAAFYLERRAEKSAFWGEARVPSFFKLIESELEAAEALMTDESALARLFQPRRTEVSLLACLDEARQAIPAAAGAPFENSLGVVPTVMSDPDELTLAFQCLLANAAEATPAGAPVVVRVLRSESAWAIEIVDGGPGLTPAEVAGAFAAFASSKPGHAGLGLNIARRIIERWQGGLSLDGLPGGGTRATVTFPRLPPGSAEG
jgi:signal transduction histidine kinase